MYALTVRQPWAWAIAEGHKPIENRTRRPPGRLLGQRIAIHAGVKAPDLDDVESVVAKLSSMGNPAVVPDEYDCGAIVATVLLRGLVEGQDLFHYFDPSGREWARLWLLRDCVGLVLGEVRKLREPVECKGQLGYWRVRPELEAQVLALGG